MRELTKIVIISVAVFLYFCWPAKVTDSTNPSINSSKGLPLQCQDYTKYATEKHGPLSRGPLELSFMRPPLECRTFTSDVIERVIGEFKSKMTDFDLFRVLENTLPNTLDTTILWFRDDEVEPRTFITTGDIHAEWLRDSARQLSVYQEFIGSDSKLKLLIKGAILQQAEYIKAAPYCNAFQPPPQSKVKRNPSSIDSVTPIPPWDVVFECKWELDSLASFFTLLNDYIENSKEDSILDHPLVKDAIQMIYTVLRRESASTFDEHGNQRPHPYTFKRHTDIGSETLPLSGAGNPVNINTGLVRSAFRASDDACIYQLHIPSNMHLVTELKRLVPVLKKHEISVMGKSLSILLESMAQSIDDGIMKHAVFRHPDFGDVFAYEVDGFGSINIMDDANIPSLLSIPDLGYTSSSDSIYLNTRKMILSKEGNPYYFRGAHFEGVGGPHVGLQYAWPMSLLVQIRTSEDDEEILHLLELLKETTNGAGLMHESVHINSPNGKLYTRPWFSWCNSEFGKTILDLAKRKPWLLFN